LSLTINSSNEFEIIDYLNNGVAECKTLSGGQGFQASLCLALAFGRKRSILNKNDKTSFFLSMKAGTKILKVSLSF
jgi:exonuclease SbcC